MATSSLVPLILCGGTGTRLWPLSRASYPKQYWPLAGTSEATLLQQTQQRLAGLPGLAPPILVCNEDHRFIVAEQMRQIDVDLPTILLEPVGRNTAPAVACCWCWPPITSSARTTVSGKRWPLASQPLPLASW
jgi:mannose-1-phosphate guanylyltransferase/mannose-6-phosphate isomerase